MYTFTASRAQRFRPSNVQLTLVLLASSIFLVAGERSRSHALPPPKATDQQDISETDPKSAASKEAALVSNARQLTFEGRRAGEGYFSRDGNQMVFQSEREPENPFFQIYVMDLETGDTERVSPGHGKTTCAWIHPQGKKVLLASTHDDQNAQQKQREEFELRHSGKQRRYSWDYDQNFEIYEYDRGTKQFKNLTKTNGYDAEGSWSPDGEWIAFASNRRAYEEGLSDQEKKRFEIDPAYLNDIYIMRADGSGLQRLTEAPGYDGGPFFSPDGKRICWRRFTPDGSVAEIWTMNIDGSDKRQLTNMNAMSWAPYYHPSGDYLIFTTNQHGFANFELYLVDVDGKSPPVRVTYTKGFDGLPVFTPDGKQLAWTTNRNASKQSQIYLADWDHQHARRLLGLDRVANVDPGDAQQARSVAASARAQATAGFSAQDIFRHVAFLCRDELAGRLTGTRGEQLATAYVAAYLDTLGLKPAGDEDRAGNGDSAEDEKSWFQEFEFTSGVALGAGNSLSSGDAKYEVDKDWRPLSFSGDGEFGPAPVVFAGYGMQVRKDEQQEEYDSFVHLDIKDKWVLVFRYMPEDISAERRQHLARDSQLRFKATVARDQGARGLIIVTGPTAKAKNRLVPLRLDGILAGSSLPVISVTDEVAEAWLSRHGKNLKQLQEKLDSGEVVMGFDVQGLEVSAKIKVDRVKKMGRNVIGRLQVGDRPSDQVIIIGAHIDHLGQGASSSSLARDEESRKIHYGADDNASGVAALLEVAEYLADLKVRGKLNARRDILFAAWSGEELGLLGSDYFVKNYGRSKDHESAANSHANPSIYPTIAAYLNMDMVGRLRKSLILQGVGSSSIWRGEIERRNAPVGLAITLHEDSYLPTDAKSFYVHGVPVLSAFTGSHSEYHTPRDTPDTVNYDGAASVARLMGLVTRSLAKREAAPDYVEQVVKQQRTGGGLRAYLGTIPDYAEEVKGVLLSGARKGGPADKAGVKTGDVIIELAGKKIENIYDYTHAIEALKIGQKVKMVVLRDDKPVNLEVVPGSRE